MDIPAARLNTEFGPAGSLWFCSGLNFRAFAVFISLIGSEPQVSSSTMSMMSAKLMWTRFCSKNSCIIQSDNSLSMMTRDRASGAVA